MTCIKIIISYISSSVSSGIIHLLTFDFVTIFPPPMFHPSKIPMADTPPKVEATHMQRNTLFFFDSFAFEQLKQAKYFKFQGVGRCTLSRQRFKLVGIISILASWGHGSSLKSYKLKKHGKISPKHQNSLSFLIHQFW